jgi:putative transposase
MRWKKHSPEEIVTKLSRVASATKSGVPIDVAADAVGICPSTYFRWRSLYGSLSPEQLHRLQQLERENARLRRVLEDIEPQALAS